MIVSGKVTMKDTDVKLFTRYTGSAIRSLAKLMHSANTLTQKFIQVQLIFRLGYDLTPVMFQTDVCLITSEVV